MTNKMYDTLSTIADFVLPGLATLYAALAALWGLPMGEAIVGTITALDAFLAGYLKYKKSKYEGDGTLEVNTTDPNAETFQVVFNSETDITKIGDKSYVTFKVVNTSQK